MSAVATVITQSEYKFNCESKAFALEMGFAFDRILCPGVPCGCSEYSSCNLCLQCVHVIHASCLRSKFKDRTKRVLKQEAIVTSFRSAVDARRMLKGLVTFLVLCPNCCYM